MTKERIKALRERLKWTQADLADRCGVSVRTVQGWEQGRKPTSSARRVLEILGSMK